MFLFENVKGLLTHDHGKTFRIITHVFQQEGYNIQWKILQAWDYGVPQKRERLFIVGVRKDLEDIYSFSFPEKEKRKRVLADILYNVPESLGASYSETKKKLFQFIPEGGNWKNLPLEKAQQYMKGLYGNGGGSTGCLRRLSMMEPSLTILTSPQGKMTERCHPYEIRPLTVRESARIQTFPDTWVFEGSLSSQYRQIGNAVPVLLALSLGKEIFSSFL